MNTLNIEQMENLEGGVWCSGNSSVNYWAGIAAGIGVVLLFTPAFAVGGTIIAHSGGAMFLNNQCLE